MSEKISISPAGEKFPLPGPEDYKTEFENLEKAYRSGENVTGVK
jgi:hypothetical protein